MVSIKDDTRPTQKEIPFRNHFPCLCRKWTQTNKQTMWHHSSYDTRWTGCATRMWYFIHVIKETLPISHGSHYKIKEREVHENPLSLSCYNNLMIK
jgi:hypothetical protein